mgnify:FL=1
MKKLNINYQGGQIAQISSRNLNQHEDFLGPRTKPQPRNNIKRPTVDKPTMNKLDEQSKMIKENGGMYSVAKSHIQMLRDKKKKRFASSADFQRKKLKPKSSEGVIKTRRPNEGLVIRTEESPLEGFTHDQFSGQHSFNMLISEHDEGHSNFYNDSRHAVSSRQLNQYQSQGTNPLSPQMSLHAVSARHQAQKSSDSSARLDRGVQGLKTSSNAAVQKNKGVRTQQSHQGPKRTKKPIARKPTPQRAEATNNKGIRRDKAHRSPPNALPTQESFKLHSDSRGVFRVYKDQGSNRYQESYDHLDSYEEEEAIAAEERGREDEEEGEEENSEVHNFEIIEAAAIFIQKNFRGYLTRKLLRDYFEQLCNHDEDEMALGQMDTNRRHERYGPDEIAVNNRYSPANKHKKGSQSEKYSQPVYQQRPAREEAEENISDDQNDEEESEEEEEIHSIEGLQQHKHLIERILHQARIQQEAERKQAGGKQTTQVRKNLVGNVANDSQNKRNVRETQGKGKEYGSVRQAERSESPLPSHIDNQAISLMNLIERQKEEMRLIESQQNDEQEAEREFLKREENKYLDAEIEEEDQQRGKKPSHNHQHDPIVVLEGDAAFDQPYEQEEEVDEDEQQQAEDVHEVEQSLNEDQEAEEVYLNSHYDRAYKVEGSSLEIPTEIYDKTKEQPDFQTQNLRLRHKEGVSPEGGLEEQPEPISERHENPDSGINKEIGATGEESKGYYLQELERLGKLQHQAENQSSRRTDQEPSEQGSDLRDRERDTDRGGREYSPMITHPINMSGEKMVVISTIQSEESNHLIEDDGESTPNCNLRHHNSPQELIDSPNNELYEFPQGREASAEKSQEGEHASAEWAYNFFKNPKPKVNPEDLEKLQREVKQPFINWTQKKQEAEKKNLPQRKEQENLIEELESESSSHAVTLRKDNNYEFSQKVSLTDSPIKQVIDSSRSRRDNDLRSEESIDKIGEGMRQWLEGHFPVASTEEDEEEGKRELVEEGIQTFWDDKEPISMNYSIGQSGKDTTVELVEQLSKLKEEQVEKWDEILHQLHQLKTAEGGKLTQSAMSMIEAMEKKLETNKKNLEEAIRVPQIDSLQSNRTTSGVQQSIIFKVSPKGQNAKSFTFKTSAPKANTLAAKFDSLNGNFEFLGIYVQS